MMRSTRALQPRHKPLLFLFALAFLALTLQSCERPGIVQDLSHEWTLQDKDGRETSVHAPGVTPLTTDGFLHLRKAFKLEPTVLALEESWLYFGNIDFPMEVRVNSQLVLKRGEFPPAPTYVQSSFPAVAAIPAALWLSGDQANLVDIKLWIHGDHLRLPTEILLGNQDFADFQVLVKLLNADFFFMFFGINLVAALYFLAVWIGHREDWPKLWFALSSFFMACYFFELGSPLAPFVFQYRAIGKACLSLSVMFVGIFFMEFFKLHATRRNRAILGVVFGAVALYVASSPDHTSVVSRFNVALIPLEALIIFVIYLLVRAFMNRHPEAPTLAVGIVLAVGFGTHDVVFQVAEIMPVVWLQGIGFFSLQVSMFLSLAMQGTRLYRTLEEYSKELLLQKDELARTNQAFARFVPREFLAFLGKNSITDVVLGDQVQQNMAILFSDIRDFTTLSERLTPHQNFNLINSYLSRMAPVVRQHGGIIDKYIGDAIMALYANGAEGAVRCALDMRATLSDYNAGRFRAGYASLDMGIGIHTGSLMLGTIGDDHRMESTVISDAVNTASRIENLTKVFRVPIIISETVLEEVAHLKHNLHYRYLGHLPVRGRQQGLGLYELIHPSDRLFDDKLLHRELFEDCVRAWEQEKRKARSLFLTYKSRFNNDPALGFFLGEANSPGELPSDND